jgi:hypothetical protein
MPNYPRCTSVSSRLIHQPDIRVLISGLQGLSLYDRYGQLSVLNAPNHEFRIYVDTFRKGDPYNPDPAHPDGELIARECFSELADRHISLSVRNPWHSHHHHKPVPCGTRVTPAANSINKYQVNPFDNDTLEREAFQEPADGSVVGSDDPHDFRWMKDLTGRHFYRRSVTLSDSFISTYFYLARGQFYTAATTSEAFDRVTVWRTGWADQGPYQAAPGERYYLGRIALVIGVNICVPEGHAALRAWDSNPYCYAATQIKDLFHFDTCKYYYKVALANLHPPFYDSSADASDFTEYGNALNQAGKSNTPATYYDIYDLQPTSRAVSHSNPCAPLGY